MAMFQNLHSLVVYHWLDKNQKEQHITNHILEIVLVIGLVHYHTLVMMDLVEQYRLQIFLMNKQETLLCSDSTTNVSVIAIIILNVLDSQFKNLVVMKRLPLEPMKERWFVIKRQAMPLVELPQMLVLLINSVALKLDLNQARLRIGVMIIYSKISKWMPVLLPRDGSHIGWAGYSTNRPCSKSYNCSLADYPRRSTHLLREEIHTWCHSSLQTTFQPILSVTGDSGSGTPRDPLENRRFEPPPQQRLELL